MPVSPLVTLEAEVAALQQRVKDQDARIAVLEAEARRTRGLVEMALETWQHALHVQRGGPGAPTP